MFGSSLPPVVCMRTHVLLTLFVFVRFLFTSSCLYEDSCLIYIICVCSVPLYLQLFTVWGLMSYLHYLCLFVPLYLQLFTVWGLMSYLHYLCLFGSSLPPVVCTRTHVLFTLFVFVRFLFTSSCLQYEDSCLINVICECLCIVVSTTYCVVILFCLSSSCVPYVASFSGLSIFDCPFVFL